MLKKTKEIARHGAFVFVFVASSLLAGIQPAQAQDAPNDPNSPPIVNPMYAPTGRPIDLSGGEEVLTPGAVDVASEALPDDFAVEDSGTSDVAAGQVTAADISAMQALLPNRVLFPVAMNDHAAFRADRMGFGAASRTIDQYPQILDLGAGAYLNWTVRTTPQRPAGLEFFQMVRVHQKLTCPNETTPDRTICPYASPPQYEIIPQSDVIQRAAVANPGSLWLIGNEIDRLDWAGGRMDEITPELYARAYHDIRAIIRKADRTARIAIGGVTQFTPARKLYLQTVWDTYRSLYKVDMPVDVWNVHNFIISEFCQTTQVNGRKQRVCYGTGMPPGQSENRGSYLGEDWRHIDMATFAKQIIDFRTWMKSIGEQDKPLIISEYGALYTTLCTTTPGRERDNCIKRYGSHYVELNDPEVVHQYMRDSFRWLTDTRDCNLSQVDDCRLVQRWIWFSLDWTGWFNAHGILADPSTTRLLGAGYVFRDYAKNNLELLQME